MNEQTIFTEALERTAPQQREAFLHQACQGDPALRQRIDRLLAQHHDAGRFLESPPVPVLQGNSPTLDQPPPERPGTYIGQYKLTEQIGEGGMGTVWMAQQSDPVKRLVAVKLIKAGMDSRQVIARFEAERQALALMDHPNIARVLDGGTTDAGRPYFVMDLVRGVPITQYCDGHQLTPRQRLELFMPVCQAVQHAHHKGIIHRDLKPSNVLVALYDGRPVPKVIDFGVAKATGQQLTEQTLVTGFGNIVGTLEYMSPEQAEINQLDIDTRSDIYSLGVLLYELLTGSPPFTRTELEKAGMLEMLRVIREEDPSKPSTKLSTAEGLPTLAANRGTEPAKLTKLVRGELDWIVMKALEKDRSRRYETANGFALDVQRYLADEPVQACPPSAAYRLRKFVRRNKGLVIGVSLALAVLVVGIIGTTWGMIRATLAEARAVHEAGEKAVALKAKSVALGEKEVALATAKASALEARKQETLAKHNAEAAKQQALLAKRRYYAAQMNLAQQAWEAADPARVLQLLETQRPKLDEPDLRGFEWYYLWRLCHRNLLRTLPGPAEQSVYALAVTPDGKTLVSGYTDASVRAWDLATGKQRAVLTGHWATIRGLAISPDGVLLASAGFEKRILLWDLTTGKLLATLNTSGAARSVAFSPDGAVLAAGTEEGTLELWDVESRSRRLTLPAHPAPLVALAYSPDGKMLATGAGWNTSRGAGTGKIWNLMSEPPQVVCEETGAVCAAFSPDSKLLATCADYGVFVRNAPSGEHQATFDSVKSGVDSVAFSSDGKTLLVGSRDRTARLWDFKSGAARAVGVHLGTIQCVAFIPRSDFIVSGSSDGLVKIWRATPSPDAPSLTAKSPIRSLAFTPDSEQLIVGSDHATLLLDADTAAETATLPVAGVFAISRAGDMLVRYASDNTREVWEVEGARPRAVLHVGPDLFPQGSGAAFSPDGTTLLTWVGDHDRLENGSVRLWDLNTSRVRATLKVPGFGLVYAAAFSPDGKRLATVRQFGTVTIWDPTTGQQGMTLEPYEGSHIGAFAVAFSNDGKMLAAGNSQGILRLWNVETGQLMTSFKGHTENIRSVAFSPDDKSLLTGSQDRTARLWDVLTGQELLALKGHKSSVQLVAFAPDGKRLAAASHDEVKIWPAATEPAATTVRMEIDRDDRDSPREANRWGDRLQQIGRRQEAGDAYRKAVSQLEKLIAAFPASPDYQQELAYSLALNLAADPHAPSTTRQQFVKTWNALSADRRFRLQRRLNDHGSELLSGGRIADGLEFYRQLTVLLPKEPSFWSWLGHAQNKSGQSEDAIAAFSRLIEVDPTAVSAWNSRGVLYSKLGRQDEAIADFRRAIDLDPANATFHYNLGSIHHLKEQHDLANMEYRKAIELDARFMKAYSRLGDLLESKQDFEGSISILRQALEILGSDQPETATIQSRLASAYESGGNLPEAIRLLEMALEQCWKNLGPDHADTVATCIRLETAYDRAIEQKPSDPHAYLGRGQIRARRGDWERAKQDFFRAVDLNPDDLAGLRQIEGAYLSLDQGQEVAALYDRALERSPSNARLRFRRDQLQPGVVASWNFDTGTDGWGAPHHCTLNASQGLLTLQTTGEDPWMIVPVTAPGGWNELTLLLRTGRERKFQLYWATERITDFTEEQSTTFSIRPEKGEWASAKVRFQADAPLTLLRLDPLPDDDTMWEIDGVTLAAFDPLQNPDHPLVLLETAKQQRKIHAIWNFAKGLEGWETLSNCKLTATDGLLAIDATGVDSHFGTAGFLAGSGRKEIRICGRFRGTHCWQVFWSTEAEYSAENSGRFVLNGGDGEWREHRLSFDAPIDFSRLRIDPSHDADFRLDLAWILLHEFSPEADQLEIEQVTSEIERRPEALQALLLRRAELHANCQDWQAASDHYARLVDLRPAYVALLEQYLSAQVSAQRWSDAAITVTRQLEKKLPDESLKWMQLATLTAQAGDFEAYDRWRRELVQKARGTTNPAHAERVAKVCLFVPPDAEICEQAWALAEFSVTSDPQHRFISSFALCHGLADYRQGEYQSAVDWCSKCLESDANSLDGVLQSHLVLAMALQRLGKPDEAAQALARGVELFDRHNNRTEQHCELDPTWHEWIICLFLRREAEELLKTEPGHRDRALEKKTN